MIQPVDTFHAHGNSQDRARDLTDKIRLCLRLAQDNFIGAGEYLGAALEMKVWEPLGYASWSAYCESAIGISDALGYDLIRIAGLREKFPEYAPRMLDVGISKLRLLLPMVEAQPDESTLDGLLDEAATQTYREFRSTVRDATRGGGEREEHPLKPVEAACPACGSVLLLSRNAVVMLK